MKKIEDIPNQANNVLSISGSNRGVFVLLLGEKKQITDMLKFAIRKRPVLREILEHSLTEEPGNEEISTDREVSTTPFSLARQTDRKDQKESKL
jgi:hypothetical protein